MRKWTISTNSYYNFGHYVLREAPWYVYAATWLNFSVVYRIVKFLTFKSMLGVRYFYAVAVPIYKKLLKYEKSTYIKREWGDLTKEQPTLMRDEMERSVESARKRDENPEFNWDEYNQRKREYSS
jgi:hypothetical protein